MIDRLFSRWAPDDDDIAAAPSPPLLAIEDPGLLPWLPAAHRSKPDPQQVAAVLTDLIAEVRAQLCSPRLAGGPLHQAAAMAHYRLTQLSLPPAEVNPA